MADSTRLTNMGGILSGLLSEALDVNKPIPDEDKIKIALHHALTSPIFNQQKNYSLYTYQGKKLIEAAIGFNMLMKYKFINVGKMSEEFSRLTTKSQYLEMFKIVEQDVHMVSKYVESSAIPEAFVKPLSDEIKVDLMLSVIGALCCNMYLSSATRDIAYVTAFSLTRGYFGDIFNDYFTDLIYELEKRKTSQVLQEQNFITYLDSVEVSDDMSIEIGLFLDDLFKLVEINDYVSDAVHAIDHRLHIKAIKLAFTVDSEDNVDNLEFLEYVGDKIMDALLVMFSTVAFPSVTGSDKITELRNYMLNKGSQALIFNYFRMDKLAKLINPGVTFSVKDMSDFVEAFFGALAVIGYLVSPYQVMNIANNVACKYWNTITQINGDRLIGPWRSQLNQGIGRDMIKDGEYTGMPRWRLEQTNDINMVHTAIIELDQAGIDNIKEHSIPLTVAHARDYPDLTPIIISERSLDKNVALERAYGRLVIYFAEHGHDSKWLDLNRRWLTTTKLLTNDQREANKLIQYYPSIKYLKEYGVKEIDRVPRALYQISYYKDSMEAMVIIEVDVDRVDIPILTRERSNKERISVDKEARTEVNDKYSRLALLKFLHSTIERR